MNVATSVLNSALWALRGIHDDTRITTSRARVTCLRHSSPFLFYNRFQTTLAFSLFADAPFPAGHRILLQKRGFRTGLLGWTIGAMLGGTIGKETDITPVETVGHLARIPEEALSSSARHSLEHDIEKSNLVGDHGDGASVLTLQETHVCHIPCAAQDGYYRVVVKAGSGIFQQLASTATFRLLSSSLHTASPRGANLFQLPVEIFAYTTVRSAQLSAWAFFYTCFPFLKMGSLIPGGSAASQKALSALWRWAGGEQKLQETREAYKVDEALAKAGTMRDNVDKAIPWSAVGVRRAFDVQADEELGRQGYTVHYKQ